MANLDLEKHGLQSVGLQDGNSLSSEHNETESSEENHKRSMFSQSFSFKGRIRRLEYGLSYIIYSVWYGIISVAVEEESVVGSIICLITFVPAIWFMLAQGCKRCHDRDNSGWYQIIPFYFLWMLFADGDVGDNDYGPNPKGINM